MRKDINMELKKLGIKRKDYSLSIRSIGYSSTAISCTIKNPYISLDDVIKVLMKYNEVEYDLRTYEVLQGGNTYVNCKYAYEIFKEVRNEFMDLAKKTIDKSLISNYGIKISFNNNSHITVFKNENSGDNDEVFGIFFNDSTKESKNFIIHSKEHLAEKIFQLNKFNEIFL